MLSTFCPRMCALVVAVHTPEMVSLCLGAIGLCSGPCCRYPCSLWLHSATKCLAVSNWHMGHLLGSFLICLPSPFTCQWLDCLLSCDCSSHGFEVGISSCLLPALCLFRAWSTWWTKSIPSWVLSITWSSDLHKCIRAMGHWYIFNYDRCGSLWWFDIPPNPSVKVNFLFSDPLRLCPSCWVSYMMPLLCNHLAPTCFGFSQSMW